MLLFVNVTGTRTGFSATDLFSGALSARLCWYWSVDLFSDGGLGLFQKDSAMGGYVVVLPRY